jgi:hypothetical protein
VTHGHSHKNEKRKMKITITALLIAFSQCILAQDTRLASIEYFNYPKAPVKDGGGNIQSSFQEYGASAAYPVQSKNKKIKVVNGIQYALVDVTVSNNSTSAINSRQFHSIIYSLTILQQLSSSWRLAASLMPTLASDFKSGLSSNDFTMQGSLLVINKLNSYTSIGGGLVYGTKLGQPMPLPAFIFRYFKDHHDLTLLLPTFANYAYQVGRKDEFDIGVRADLNGADFHVSGNNLDSAVHVNKLSYSRINLGLVVSYKITKVIKLEARGGISTARKYQFLDADGNKYSFNTNNVPFFNVGLVIVPLENRGM